MPPPHPSHWWRMGFIIIWCSGCEISQHDSVSSLFLTTHTSSLFTFPQPPGEEVWNSLETIILGSFRRKTKALNLQIRCMYGTLCIIKMATTLSSFNWMGGRRRAFSLAGVRSVGAKLLTRKVWNRLHLIKIRMWLFQSLSKYSSVLVCCRCFYRYV